MEEEKQALFAIFHLLKPELIISWTFIRSSYINSIRIFPWYFRILSTQIIQFVFEISHRCTITPFRRIWTCKILWSIIHGFVEQTSWNLSSIQVVYFKWFLFAVNSQNLNFKKLSKIMNIGIYFILCSCYLIWQITIVEFCNLFGWAGKWIEQAYSSIISTIN